MIPDKNLFIVTSALEPRIGLINKEDRFQQTIDTLINLRKKVPDALIILSDGSPVQPDEKNRKEISKYTNCTMYWCNDDQIKEFADCGRKSEAEILLLLKTFTLLRQNVELSKMMASVKRIFKYSARTILLDDFKISLYNNSKLFGKYVFKKRVPTWITDKTITDHLLQTRLYSLCPSLIDNYVQTLLKVLNSCTKYGIDTENAHFREIDKKYLIELNKLYCKGILAGTGEEIIF
tara:strand:- start:521 stop:1225 length:705 start_codon:yes stop_codon:yes gene_type:complete